eukprot:m.231101 g.231101  ORF g.231101 m.231101 type:complete len:175 (-) comp18242_c0_seq1:25-549(-)
MGSRPSQPAEAPAGRGFMCRRCEKPCVNNTCNYHDDFAFLGGNHLQKTFLFYWCCGAVDRHTKGCIPGKSHDPVPLAKFRSKFADVADNSKKKTIKSRGQSRVARLEPVLVGPDAYKTDEPVVNALVHDLVDFRDSGTSLPPILRSRHSWVDSSADGANELPFWEGHITATTSL